MWPPDLVLRAIEALHSTSDLPWWLAIGVSTALVRSALLPLTLSGSRQQARMQRLRTELAPLHARLQANGRTDAQATADQMDALYTRHGVSPYRMLLLPLLQLPIFMSFFVGLRRLADAFPDAHEGGAFWFIDLGARDETLWLPVASGLSALALVRLSVPGATMGMTLAEAQQAELMRKVLSGVALVSLPVACTMPVSVLVFWITNNVYSLCYSGLLTFPSTREALGLPPRAGEFVGARDAGGAGASGTASLQPAAAEFGRAQELAAATLAELADRMAERGKLEEAVSMQRRAVAMSVDAHGKNGADDDGQCNRPVREALWRLAELQEQAGRSAEAEASVARWKRAGGDATVAAEWLRCRQPNEKEKDKE